MLHQSQAQSMGHQIGGGTIGDVVADDYVVDGYEGRAA
jgi:hypothetical protein